MGEPSIIDLRHRLHVEKLLVQMTPGMQSRGSEVSARDIGSATNGGIETQSVAHASDSNSSASAPSRTGRTQGRPAPPRQRLGMGAEGAAANPQRRTGPNTAALSRAHGQGTAVDADGAGGPVT